jgi:hypothetical protein
LDYLDWYYQTIVEPSHTNIQESNLISTFDFQGDIHDSQNKETSSKILSLNMHRLRIPPIYSTGH